MLLGGHCARPSERKRFLRRGGPGYLVEVPFPAPQEMFGVKRVVLSSDTLLPMELRKLRNAILREVGKMLQTEFAEGVNAEGASAILAESLARTVYGPT